MKDSIYRQWGDYLKKIRSFFESREFLEVETKHLVEAGAFEASLDTLGVGGFELHTSPEMEMKMILSEEQKSMFQICHVFRDDPKTCIHSKEFMMLEFYEVGASYEGIRNLTKDLFKSLGCEEPVEEWSIGECLGTDFQNENDFYRKVVELEPRLPQSPVLLKDYPAFAAALLATNPDGKTAQRFEIYWKGIELCNGGVELGDTTELAARIEKEKQTRFQEGKKSHPYPKTLVKSLEKGLPPCAGVAVGLDRLFFCLTGSFGPVFRP